MVYGVLCKVIAEICHQVCIPLTPREISHILCDVVDEDMAELVCRYMCEEGKLIRCRHHTFTLRRLGIGGQHRANVLISLEYQQLGMQMLETAPNSFVRYIRPGCEHRFLEIRPSTIGSAAGMGLFVRCTRRIPQGCIFCEYRGRQLRSLPVHDKDRLYVVQVRNTSTFIDGVTSGGDHLSLATFINDNGPAHMNAGMTEFSCHPGRVFLLAARDLNPGEEIFVLYGPKYWGFQSYGEKEPDSSLAVGRETPASFLSSDSFPLSSDYQNGEAMEKTNAVTLCDSSFSRRRTRNMKPLTSEGRRNGQRDGRSKNNILLQPMKERCIPAAIPVVSSAASYVNVNNAQGRSGSGGARGCTARNGRGARRGKRKREGEDSLLAVMRDLDMENSPFPCRSCGETVLRRTRALHQPHCGDPLVKKKLTHLDCMPLNSFTTVSHWDRLRMRIAPSARSVNTHRQGEHSFSIKGDPLPNRLSYRFASKATSMVDRDNPHTFSHTHMDVVKDLEFSFHDISDPDP